MSEDGSTERLVATASPALSRVMFLFNPPPEMTTEQMRKRASIALLASTVLMAAVFWLTPRLMAYKGPVGSVGFGLIIFTFGTAFLLVPASLFRIIFGVTGDDIGGKIIRGFVGVVLFLMTSIGSCLLYGQITQ